MSNVSKIKERVDEFTRNFTALKASMDELEEWNSIDEIVQNFKKLGKFVTSIVMAVELAVDDLKADLEDLKSEEKLEAAVKVLDEKVKLPWFLEVIDGPTFRLVLSLAVFFLNGIQGDKWDMGQVRNALNQGLEEIGFNVK